MPSYARRGDFWSGLALAALAAYILAQARAWPYMTEEGPGPGFFPMWYGGAMLVLSLALVAGTVLSRRATGRELQWRELRRAFACWAAFVACIALPVAVWRLLLPRSAPAFPLAAVVAAAGVVLILGISVR